VLHQFGLAIPQQTLSRISTAAESVFPQLKM
jgi:hypothetical protein